MELSEMLNRIDKTKEEIDKRRPLSMHEVRQLDAYFRIGTTYATNAIEGNSLTLTETKVLLENGITIGGKPISECYEAIGHAEAYDYMIEIARGNPLVITKEMIMQLHKLFYARIDLENAGRYRNERVFITGTQYIPPQPDEIPRQMDMFLKALYEKWEDTHPVLLAAYAHKTLVDIHPFVDGNGRTARLLMNMIIVNRGYQIITIPPILRTEYINALESARRTNPLHMVAFDKFIAECEIEAQKDYCRMFQITPAF